MLNGPFGSLPPPSCNAGEDEVHVWLAKLNQPGIYLAQLEKALSNDEHLRAQRFYFERDRRHFIVARGLLRLILGRYLGLAPAFLQFTYGLHGKPKLASPEGDRSLRFNLSHSQELVLYAVSFGREVGVDIEYMRPLDDLERIARNFFSTREQTELQLLPAELKQQAFFDCWVRKEAYIKAIGEGLFQALDQFEVSFAPGTPAQLLNVQDDPNGPMHWSLQELQAPSGYAAALAVEGHDFHLSCWKWDGALLPADSS